MYLSNSSLAYWDDWEIAKPIWEEKDLFYNFESSNYREKIVKLSRDEVKFI